MMISYRYLVLIILFCFFMLSGALFAQDDEGHIFIVTTHKVVIPEGGSAAERDSLLTEMINAQKSNSKILSEKTLVHLYGNNSQDWVVITEYASWADVEAAAKINDELNKKKWPDQKKRQEFFRKLGKYFAGHSDEIYMEKAEFGK